MTQSSTLASCQAGIATWQRDFNRQDAAGSAAQYQAWANMEVRPFGRFCGREQIQAFWQGSKDQGFAEVASNEVSWTPRAADDFEVLGLR